MNGSDQPIHSCDSDAIDPQKVLHEGHLHSEHSEIALKHHTYILGPSRAGTH